MKHFTLILILLAASVAGAADPAPIPVDKVYLIEIAVYSLALDKIAAIGQTPDNLTEYVDLMMARDIIASPGQKPVILAQYAQASKEGAGQTVNWSTVTLAQVKTTIGLIWTSVAMQRFGPAPAQPGV